MIPIKLILSINFKNKIMKKIYILSFVFCLIMTNTFSQPLSKKINLISNGFELTMNSESCCQNAKNLQLKPKLFDVGYRIENSTISGINFSDIYLIFFENKLWNIDYVLADKTESLKIEKILFEKYGINKAIKDSLTEKNTMSYTWQYNDKQKICFSINDITNRYDLMYYDSDLKTKFYSKRKSNF